MKSRCEGLFDGAMRGRTMYVIPSRWARWVSIAHVGVELTTRRTCGEHADDDAHGAWSMTCWERTARSCRACTRSARRSKRTARRPWPCIGRRNTSSTFRRARHLVVRSGYGGNALLGKKCFALRIASAIGRDQGWLAEHMLILGVKDPSGQKTYVAAAFPSACGKTNFAMLIPPQPFREEGWEVTTVGDDIAWLKPGPDQKLYAINPEFGFFGVAPGTSYETNPNAMETMRANTIFTNGRAHGGRGRVVGGLTTEPPSADGLDGQGWTAAIARRRGAGAHPTRVRRAARAMSIARSRLGRRPACQSRPHLRRTAARRSCPRSIRPSTGTTASTRLRRSAPR